MTTIRPLTEVADFQKCLELQRDTWGMADVDLLPSRIYLVQTLIGGLVLGAFEGDRLIGFLNAMPGIREGKPYWHSLTMAVHPDYWNCGIGSMLKLTQRDAARQRGIKLIQWTYDPLQSKNAYLNVRKLGAVIRKYHQNLYGATTSALFHGLDTDRVIAEWWVEQPRI